MADAPPIDSESLGAAALRIATKWAKLDDPVIELYKKDVDRTLLRENLRRSPEERLRNLQALQRFAAEVRKAGEAMRNRDK